MKTLYVETSVISYLTALPARDLIVAAWQSATHQWWRNRRTGFELCTSQLVLDEASAGHPDAAARRIQMLSGLPILPITDTASELAVSLLKEGAMPEKAADDALHLAIAAYHGVDYLLTWNCRHLDNAEMKPVMRSVCAIRGYACPEICTPLELMGDEHER